jgi:dTDP-4-amino-4,6-dideoxygalactose transaminase
MEAFKEVAEKHGLWSIEDACHAPGGYFIDSQNAMQYCGGGVYAELAIFSFHPVKHIACGEGGMITTNDKSLYDKLQRLRTHGITKQPDLLQENHGGWYYEMHDLGFNYRLSDIQATLGASQLGRAVENLEKRQSIAHRYDIAFKDTPVAVAPVPAKGVNAYHLYVIQVENRKQVYETLRDNNIYTQVHYIPVHLQPYYRQLGWKKGDLPNAERYYEHCLSLPMYPTLTEAEQDFVIAQILKAL